MQDRRLVSRVSQRPVVCPGDVPGHGPVFNAGLLYHEGQYHLFARAIRRGYNRNTGPGPRFLDYISDIVVLTSQDGLQYRFGYVLAPAGTEGASCFEDPRVQRVGDMIVMTYTRLPLHGAKVPWSIGAHKLIWEDGRFKLSDETGRVLGPRTVEDKDSVIFRLADGRIAFLHRVHPNIQLAVFDDFECLWRAGARYWDGHLRDLQAHTLIAPEQGALGVGAGAPPVETDSGFLLFFHERRSDGSYTMNLALLDLQSGKVKARLPYPILEPELPWERRGDVENVIFVEGAHRSGDEIYLVYGAADRYVGAATCSVSELLSALEADGTATAAA